MANHNPRSVLDVMMRLKRQSKATFFCGWIVIIPYEGGFFFFLSRNGSKGGENL